MTEGLDEFHKHEVLHTAYVLADTWDSHICEHVYTQSNKELYDIAWEAFLAMDRLYQAIGTLDD